MQRKLGRHGSFRRSRRLTEAPQIDNLRPYWIRLPGVRSEETASPPIIATGAYRLCRAIRADDLHCFPSSLPPHPAPYGPLRRAAYQREKFLSISRCKTLPRSQPSHISSQLNRPVVVTLDPQNGSLLFVQIQVIVGASWSSNLSPTRWFVEVARDIRHRHPCKLGQET